MEMAGCCLPDDLTYPYGVCYAFTMKQGTCHHSQMPALRRIEGQIRGVQRMIGEKRYCVEILNAVSAVMGALRKVETNILKEHLNDCAKTAFEGKSRRQKNEKMSEIFSLLEGLKR